MGGASGSAGGLGDFGWSPFGGGGLAGGFGFGFDVAGGEAFFGSEASGAPDRARGGPADVAFAA